MAITNAGGGSEPVGPHGPERVVYVVQQPVPSQDSDSEKIGQAFRKIWRRRRFVASITALFGLVGVSYALLATPWYRADAHLLPRDSKSGSGLSSQLAQLGGLANLAGINLGPVGKEEPVAVLKSRGFSRSFIEKRGLMPALLTEASGPFDKLLSAGGSSDADIRDAVKFFDEEVLGIAEDRKTGLLTVTIEWTDPAEAAAWANSLVSQVNEEMRTRALKEAQANVAFLQAELQKSDVISLQQALGRLLESEMQKLMLARGNEDFSFKVIDHADVPKLRSRPARTAIVILSLLLGGMLSVAFVLARRQLSSREDD